MVAELKRGRTLLEDDTQAGRPVEATTNDCCHAVEKPMMGDRRLKVLAIATEVGVSYGSVLNILHKHLGFCGLESAYCVMSQGPSQMGPMFSGTRSEVISGGNMFQAVGYLHCNPGKRVVLYNNW